MTEHPILFSGPLVRAILDGRKTVTRRVVTQIDRHDEVSCWGWPCDGANPHTGRVCSEPIGPEWHHYHDRNGFHHGQVRCLYGAPGHLLWVRETWRVNGTGWDMPPVPPMHTCEVEYRADGATHCIAVLKGVHDREDARIEATERWRPSIHMPRWASRLTLRVTDVRVERVQEITEEDIVREGLDHVPGDPTRGSYTEWIHLWNAINAARGYPWESNPWVWRIAFERVESMQEAAE